MQAKKSFGQHFLNRPEIAKRIADSLTCVGGVDNRVLEVGPGKGMLTQFLVGNKFNLLAVEADRDMIVGLERQFTPLSNGGNFRVVFEDFLRFRLESAFEAQPFCLIGNFPYNISSQIVIKMLENRPLVPEMVGMFQKEMALRIVAKAGGKDYGVLSVLTQAYYEGKLLFDVDRTCFSPPPNVQSAIIRLVRKENQELGCDERLFRNVVKMSFNQRRKMLRNTLKSYFDKDPSVLTEEFFTKRPETLTVADFVALTQRIEQLNKS
jgi:16S rRNA (adenine1518-N6/adenine1519-N6)-dimethyltransferase